MNIFSRQFFLLVLLTLSIEGFGQVKPKKEVSAATTKKDTNEISLNNQLKAVKWRNIGPFRGGRSVATSGVVGNMFTYYMGVTGGGLWKTTDMGITWANISDGYFQTGSVGAVAVAESDANIVYVGMGEHAIRGVMTHHGDGIYKSTDAGKTWKKLGLELTQHISRVVIHPKNPDIVYVAAQGALYGTSKERGIYKSIDGGATWNKVLFVNEKTGGVELSMDMNNPGILYAAMWEHGREPWKITSGGPGSGLYKSTDSGLTWMKIHQGLPGEMGKMAIAVCRSNSDKVYALIESDSKKDNKGLFVSENGGKSWSLVSNDNRLVQRAWYYIELFIDPLNENVLYVLSAPALKSIDGGKTWELMQTMHGDHHDMWINPFNSQNFAMADDGGVSITINGGKSWSDLNLPTGQFYRINVDNQFPYNIYSGQQDNTSIVIASRESGGYGISSNSWTYSAGGESAFLAFDPDNPRYVMGGSYLGTIEILDTKAKAGTSIMAAPIQYLAKDPKDMKYRFNWNAPIIHSNHEKGTFYHGAQLLLKTSDMGKTWKEVSPDLTRNDKSKQGPGGGPYTNEVVGAENYGTLSYVIESIHEKGVIWTGSDDGLVHVTRDNGVTWTNVTPKELKECLINAIEISPFEKGTVYIATTRYKFNDHTPGLYKTTDYGKTWQNISGNLPANAFTRVVREDDKVKGLLYAGTELGVFISYNSGANWQSFQLNLPVTPITDLKVHRDNLIAATSGRAFWILDDLPLIRSWNQEMKDKMVMYRPSDVVLVNGGSELNYSSNDFSGSHPTRGINPATGMVLYYNLPELKVEDIVTLRIYDVNGKVIREISSKVDSTYRKYDGGPQKEPVISKNKGLNRFVWDLRHATMPGVSDVYIESSYAGHKAIPGKYKIELSHNDVKSTIDAEILKNPDYVIGMETYQAYNDLMSGMESNVRDMHNLVNQLFKKRNQLESLLKSLPNDEKYINIRNQGNSIIKTATEWDNDMVQRLSKAYDDVENFPNKFTAEYMFMMNQCESDIPQINQSALDLLKELNAKWETLRTRGIQISDSLIPEFNKVLWDAGIGGIW